MSSRHDCKELSGPRRTYRLAFAAGTLNPISGQCTLTYQTKRPPFSPRSFTKSSRRKAPREATAAVEKHPLLRLDTDREGGRDEVSENRLSS